jgi:hypothetical protein
MTIVGWAKGLLRAKRKVARIAAIGHIHTDPKGISILLSNDDGEEHLLMEIQIETAEWRKLTQNVQALVEQEKT